MNAGADPNSKTPDMGLTPLSFSVHDWHLANMLVLLENGTSSQRFCVWCHHL
jgi:hypothetical protein